MSALPALDGIAMGHPQAARRGWGMCPSLRPHAVRWRPHVYMCVTQVYVRRMRMYDGPPMRWRPTSALAACACGRVHTCTHASYVCRQACGRGVAVACSMAEAPMSHRALRHRSLISTRRDESSSRRELERRMMLVVGGNGGAWSSPGEEAGWAMGQVKSMLGRCLDLA